MISETAQINHQIQEKKREIKKILNLLMIQCMCRTSHTAYD